MKPASQLIQPYLTNLETFMLLTASVQGSNQGMSPDLVWEIDNYVASQTAPKATTD